MSSPPRCQTNIATKKCGTLFPSPNRACEQQSVKASQKSMDKESQVSRCKTSAHATSLFTTSVHLNHQLSAVVFLPLQYVHVYFIINRYMFKTVSFKCKKRWKRSWQKMRSCVHNSLPLVSPLIRLLYTSVLFA